MKVVFFDLFLFATGYKVGPQFFRGLKKNALLPGDADRRPVRDEPRHDGGGGEASWATTCGTAAGLMAGAFTESTVIGTAGQHDLRGSTSRKRRRHGS